METKSNFYEIINYISNEYMLVIILQKEKLSIKKGHLFIIYKDKFNIVDPHSKQDTWNTQSQLNGLALHEFSWLGG